MTRPGFTFCICPDSALIKQYVDEAAAKFPPPAAETGGMPGCLNTDATVWDRQIFWGDDNLEDDFWNNLGVQSLFGGGRMIILRNAQSVLADTWKKLSKSLARANPAIWIIICLEVEFERGQPKIPAHIKRLKSFEFAEKQGWLWQNPGLGGKGMYDYITQQGKLLNIVVPTELMPRLASALPADATAINLELQKLALLIKSDGGSNEIKAKHLELIDNPVEVDIYAVLRSLQNNQNPCAVWESVLASESGASKDKMLFGFLGALVREARILWQLLFGEKVYVPGPANLAIEKQALARKLGIRRLAEIWELALEAEQGVKSGKVSEEQALERLTADLSLLFAKY